MNILKAKALFYAYGAIDHGSPGSSDDALEFADRYGAMAERHEAGEITYLPAIQDAWRDFGPR